MVSDLITRLASWLRRLPPPDERFVRLAAALEEQFGGRRDPATAAACAEIERVAWRYSRHLLLHFDPAGTGAPDEVAPGWPGVVPQVECPAPEAVPAALAHVVK
jgi:hypothetical protein